MQVRYWLVDALEGKTGSLHPSHATMAIERLTAKVQNTLKEQASGAESAAHSNREGANV